MSDVFTPTSGHDPITHRLVTALDRLPVPPGPSGLRAGAPRARVSDPRLIALAFAMIMLVTAVSSPEFRDAAAELSRYIQRILSGPGWVGYYVDFAAQDASGQPASRVLFVSSNQLPGRPLSPDIVGRFADHGPWSPDGEHVTVHNDTTIYVGDRRGNLRQVADVGAGFNVDRSGWIDDDHVFGVLSTQTGIETAPSSGRAGLSWFATVDLRSGAVDLRRLETQLPGRAFAAVSPDGRWLPVALGVGGCGFATGLYDLSTHRIVPVLDTNGRPATAAVGFLTDGRLVSMWCDRAAGILELYIGAPGSSPVLIATVQLAQNAPLVAVTRGREAIVVVSQSPAAPQIVPVFDTTGRVVRRIELPQLSADAALDQAGLSRDWNDLSFVVREVQGGQLRSRAGVVDLVTGQITYLCAADCARLAIGAR